MSRPWTSSKPKNRKSKGDGNRAPGTGSGSGPDWARLGPSPNGTPSGAELIDGPVTLVPERYESRPVRPWAQMAVRAGLWGAIGLGVVGGLVGLLRTPPEADAVDDTGPTGPQDVPAPVAGTAETVVRAWLTVNADNEDEVEAMFVDVPDLNAERLGGLRVGRTTAIAGRVLQEGYWAVTVATEVTEDVPVTDGEDPGRGEDAGAVPDSEETEERTTTWYLEVAVVGDPESGLMALNAPAVLPGAPQPTTGWLPSAAEPEPPEAEDPTAEAVEGFLNALLAGDGNPGRYVAPRVAVTAADPPLFARIDVIDQAIDEMETGHFRVLARVEATTPGGSIQTLTYELLVVERVDRLEITQFSGAPTLVAGTAEPPATEGEGEATEDQVTEDPAATDDTSDTTGATEGTETPDTTEAEPSGPATAG